MRHVFQQFPSEGGVARSDGVVHFCNGWRLIEPVESQNRQGYKDNLMSFTLNVFMRMVSS